jgi:hypothetical protein
MKRATRLFALSVAVLSGSAGCSAPAACEESDSSHGLLLESQGVSGSARAENADESAEFKMRATLSGLPRLWQGESAILQADLDLEVSLVYEAEPKGGDGHTQMPSVSVTFDPQAPNSWQPSRTSEFPGPAPTSFRTALFGACYTDGQGNCCPYGVRECSLPVTLRLERVQGTPFPPIVISWSARLTASVSACPLNDSVPMLALELESP